jgi:hypothetical protein
MYPEPRRKQKLYWYKQNEREPAKPEAPAHFDAVSSQFMADQFSCLGFQVGKLPGFGRHLGLEGQQGLQSKIDLRRDFTQVVEFQRSYEGTVYRRNVFLSFRLCVLCVFVVLFPAIQSLILTDLVQPGEALLGFCVPRVQCQCPQVGGFGLVVLLEHAAIVGVGAMPGAVIRF